MTPFPDEYELISLFESEPVLADANVPWAYNHLRFTRTMGRDTLECAIEPGYERLKVQWRQNGREVLSLDLRCVSGLTVECDSGRETLVAHFRDGRGVSPVRLQFTPAIHVSWGTTQELI